MSLSFSGDYLPPFDLGSSIELRSSLNSQGEKSQDTANDEVPIFYDVDMQDLLADSRLLPPLLSNTVERLREEIDDLKDPDVVHRHLCHLAAHGDQEAFQIFEQAYSQSQLVSRIPLDTLLSTWDAGGLPPLSRAVQCENLAAVEALIRMGAPPALLDAEQMTPLVQSLHGELTHFFEASHDGSAAVASAISKRLRMVDGGFSAEYLHRKLLAQMFAMEGTSELQGHTFDLEGLQLVFSLKAAIDSGALFYNRLCSDAPAQENEIWNAISSKVDPRFLDLINERSQAILQAIHTIPELLQKSLLYFTVPDILDQLQPGEPLPLLGGWSQHMVGAVVVPYEHRSELSTQPEIRYDILVCNRGEHDASWGSEQPGVQAFRTDRRGADEVLANWDEQLHHLKDSLVKEEREIASYTQTPIRDSTDGELIATQFLHHQGIVDAWAAHLMALPRAYYFEAIPYAILPQSAQVVGNCTWANLQSVELALVYQRLSQFLPREVVQDLAQVLIDLREAEAQAFAARDYFAFHSVREYELAWDPRTLKYELPWDPRILNEAMSQLEINADNWKTTDLVTACSEMRQLLARVKELEKFRVLLRILNNDIGS